MKSIKLLFIKNKNLFISSFLFLITFLTKLFLSNKSLVLFTNLVEFSFLIDLVFIGIFIYISIPVFSKMLSKFKEGEYLSEELLMVISSLCAIFTKNYSESSAIIILYLFGDAITDISIDKSKKSIKDLIDLHICKCTILKNGVEEEIDAKDIAIGQIVCLKAGDVVPVDGVIVKGCAFFDVSDITGESNLISYKAGDNVLSGYTVVDAPIMVRAQKIFSDSSSAQILNIVESSADTKSSHENVINKFVKIYTPVMLFVAFCIGVLVPIFTKTYDFNRWIYKSASILVATCPCSLIVSIPLAYYLGIGVLAKKNVYIKSASTLQKFSQLDELCFDKTGTLAYPGFKIDSFDTTLNEELFKKIVASAESFSNHPIAKAIFNEWKLYSDSKLIRNLQELAGVGLKFDFDSKSYVLASKKYFGSSYIKNSNMKTDVNDDFRTCVCLFSGDCIVGEIKLVSKEREDSIKLVGWLKENNFEIAMLTGDNKFSAKHIAQIVGIDIVKSDLLPQEKGEYIEHEQRSGKKVCYVGDGINDAVSISKADIGASVGGVSSESTRNISDCILEGGNIIGIKSAICVSRFVKNIVVQNVVFSLLVKAIFVLLALFGITRMWFSAFSDGGLLILTVLNATRVFLYKKTVD